MKFVFSETYEAPVEIDAQGIKGKFRVKFLRIEAEEYARILDDIRVLGDNDEPGAVQRLVAFRAEKLDRLVVAVLDLDDAQGKPLTTEEVKPQLIHSPPFGVALMDSFIHSNQNAKAGNSKPSARR